MFAEPSALNVYLKPEPQVAAGCSVTVIAVELLLIVYISSITPLDGALSVTSDVVIVEGFTLGADAPPPLAAVWLTMDHVVELSRCSVMKPY